MTNEDFEKCLSAYAAAHTTGSTALLRKVGLHFFDSRQPEIDALIYDNKRLYESLNSETNERCRLEDENAALKEQIERHLASLDEWRGKVRELQAENAALKAEVERLRKDAERFGILLREFMYCEVHSNEEIEEGAELIKRYRAMKETK